MNKDLIKSTKLEFVILFQKAKYTYIQHKQVLNNLTSQAPQASHVCVQSCYLRHNQDTAGYLNLT